MGQGVPSLLLVRLRGWPGAGRCPGRVGVPRLQALLNAPVPPTATLCNKAITAPAAELLGPSGAGGGTV